jgi:hypothetical protein
MIVIEIFIYDGNNLLSIIEITASTLLIYEKIVHYIWSYNTG